MLTYVGMWSLMMAAMMLPTVHRVTALYVRAVQQQNPAPIWMGRLAVLCVGYLLIWSVIGVPVYGIGVLVAMVIPPYSETATWFSAVLIAASGIFQFSSIKDRCLHHCQSPMAFVAKYMAMSGWSRDLRAGLVHGLNCLGCCAAMVGVLIAVGTMNLPWMILLGVVAMVEKTWRHGRQFSHAVGIGMMMYALAIIAAPDWAAPLPHGLDSLKAVCRA